MGNVIELRRRSKKLMRGRTVLGLIFVSACAIVVPLKLTSAESGHAVPGKVMVVERDGSVHEARKSSEMAKPSLVDAPSVPGGIPAEGMSVPKAKSGMAAKSPVDVRAGFSGDGPATEPMRKETPKAGAETFPMGKAEALDDADANALLLRMAEEREADLGRAARNVNGHVYVPKAASRNVRGAEPEAEAKAPEPTRKADGRRRLSVIAEKSAISDMECFPSRRR